jgi:hypothetical protein
MGSVIFPEDEPHDFLDISILDVRLGQFIKDYGRSRVGSKEGLK